MPLPFLFLFLFLLWDWGRIQGKHLPLYSNNIYRVSHQSCPDWDNIVGTPCIWWYSINLINSNNLDVKLEWKLLQKCLAYLLGNYLSFWSSRRRDWINWRVSYSEKEKRNQVFRYDFFSVCFIDSKITSRINISLTISLHRCKGIRKQMSYYFKFILNQN